ncbi:MAG TPA: hypothetical protein DCE71_03655 [Parachlamydiales bacterium]|nr:hypothetical protein [Parachlamydiales bacterium]
MPTINLSTDKQKIIEYPTPPKFQIDPYKVSRIAAIAFTLLAGADIILRLGFSLSSFGFLATPAAWIIGGSVLLISGIFVAVIYYIQERAHQKNYKNPEELQQLKEAAIELNFDELLQEHTLNNLVAYIFNETDSPLSLSSLKEKFTSLAIETPDFESLTRNYDLKELTRLQIIDESFVLFLHSLGKKVDAAQKKHQKNIRRLENTYPLRLSSLNAGISSIYDFFSDRYKMIRTCIQYGINAADLPRLQQIKYSRAESIYNAELKKTCDKVQEEYSQRCRDFFPAKMEEDEKASRL